MQGPNNPAVGATLTNTGRGGGRKRDFAAIAGQDTLLGPGGWRVLAEGRWQVLSRTLGTAAKVEQDLKHTLHRTHLFPAAGAPIFVAAGN